VRTSEDRRFALLKASAVDGFALYLCHMDRPETPARPVGDPLRFVIQTVRSFRVSPDNQWMVIESFSSLFDPLTSPTEVSLWDCSTEQIREIPKDRVAAELSAHFPPNMRTDGISKPFSIELDHGELRLLDVNRGNAEPVILAKGVGSMATSPDEGLVAAVSDQGEIALHRTHAAGRTMVEQLRPLLQAAEDAVGRNLSTQEWQKYLSDFPYRKTFDKLPGPDGIVP
jgi:hypothetical protein